MAEKTVLKALISKYGIMSTDMQRAVVSDRAKLDIDFETGEENINYVDNLEVIETVTIEQQEEFLKKYDCDTLVLPSFLHPNNTIDMLKNSLFCGITFLLENEIIRGDIYAK